MTASFLNKAKEFVLEILLPRFCLGCGKEGRYICEGCELFLSEAENISPYLTSCWEYEGIIEKAIHEIKFNGVYHIVSELVEKAFEKIDLDLFACAGRPENALITFVPMFKKREKERGFNVAEVIACQLGNVLPRGKHKPFKVVPLLEKNKDNQSQVGLGPKERLENVKGVFRLSLGIKEMPESVLLVDDVYTTGATMNECIKVLRKAGVKNVWGFTLARKLNI
jgi:competence protein ComFC